MTATRALLTPRPLDRAAKLDDDAAFCVSYARDLLDKAERMHAEAVAIRQADEERRALRRDERLVSVLAGSRARAIEEEE